MKRWQITATWRDADADVLRTFGWQPLFATQAAARAALAAMPVNPTTERHKNGATFERFVDGVTLDVDVAQVWTH